MTRRPGVAAGRLALGLAVYALTPEAPRAFSAAPEAPFRFVDVAAQAGLTRVLLSGRPDKDHLLDSSGGGVAFLDYDRDGRLDVYLVNGWRSRAGRSWSEDGTLSTAASPTARSATSPTRPAWRRRGAVGPGRRRGRLRR